MTQLDKGNAQMANSGASLFADCDGLLAELSASDEAVLTGGTGYKGYGRGSSSSGSGRGGYGKRGFGSSSSGRGGFKGYSYGYKYFKPHGFHH